MLAEDDIEARAEGSTGRPGRTRPMLVCYFPIGDPRVPADLLDIYAEEGVDVIELGLASPDPYLDGADVRNSMARADRAQYRRDLDAVLKRITTYANHPQALVMTYVDPAHPGLADQGFWRGLDALLVVAPPTAPLRRTLEDNAREAGVALSTFVGLPFTPADLTAAASADYYVMLQAGHGVTGPRETVDEANRERIAELRRAGVTAPILLGFGISNGAQARTAIELGADGIIVGSTVLRAALDGPDRLRALLCDLRRGLDG